MGLHLLAQSAEDVPALSALVQDGAVRRADIHYDAQARRLVLLMARYCWDSKTPQRSRAALRIDHVRNVQQRGFGDDAMLNLLSVQCEASHLHIIFAGTATLRLEIEAVDLTLDDFGEPWKAVAIPKH
jgi:hypothetical protein